MANFIFASLVLAMSTLPLHAQTSTLHTDRSGYTTGTDGNRTVKAYSASGEEKEVNGVGDALEATGDKIADAAVIGVRDDEGEEVPKAFVVTQASAELTADEVMAFVAERIAPHKKVRVVEFIEEIPKSASGKILRKDLRARETAKG